MADGLSYLLYSLAHLGPQIHQRGIIHGDLKPGNILIKILANGRQKVSIADLDDLVQMRDSATCSADVSHLRGTVRYMSPEMLNKFALTSVKKETPGRKTDVWSLGCIMLELGDCVVPAQSRGKRLCREDSRTTVEAGHALENSQFAVLVIDGYIPFVAEAIPPDFAQCIRRCLTRNTEQRWSSNKLLQKLCNTDLQALTKARQERHMTGVFRYNQESRASKNFGASVILFDSQSFTVQSFPLPENLQGNACSAPFRVQRRPLCSSSKIGQPRNLKHFLGMRGKTQSVILDCQSASTTRLRSGTKYFSGAREPLQSFE
ncbi:uncharacterized protein LOC129602047 isoform X2 [Paramacrobiotus metropolitanus]|nr:uncharacterized protein LOC129602047 isoform X2 [Paramacrobiotus metropolitanus]